MRSADSIIREFHERRKSRGPVIAQMERLRAQYNGDVVVPLPELDRDEKAAVANLVQQGLDKYGQRIASVMPNLDCPAVDERSTRSRNKASIRRGAHLSWWEANRFGIKTRRRARELIGYACTPVTMRPDFTRGIPRWDLRSPLACFPAPCSDPDDLTPPDSIQCIRRPLGYIRRVWPQSAHLVAERDVPDSRLYDLLEYDDADQVTVILLGGTQPQGQGLAPYTVLENVPNRAGIPLTVVPGRITLDRAQGQFDGILGMYQMQAKLMALSVHATLRGVYPDTYLIARQGETPSFISGPHPGYTGEVNIVEGGDIKEVNINPGFAAPQTMDRLERGMRVDAGIASEFGGESGTNIRTGRRGDAVMSAMVDFPVQEAQELLAASAEEENRRAVRISKAYFGNEPKSFHVSWGTRKPVAVDYVPNRDFDSEYTMVSYAMAGADVNNLTVGVGQLVGTGLLSKDTSRRLHPWIDDPDLEGDKVTAEGLEAALLQSLQNQAAAGEIPPADLARITTLVYGQNMSLADAVQKVQEEAQERQAQQVPPTAPEAMPGLAVPGAGAEAGLAIEEPPASLGNLDQLFQQLGAA